MPKPNTSFGLSELERIKHANTNVELNLRKTSVKTHSSNKNQENMSLLEEASFFFSVSLLGVKFLSDFGIPIHRIPHELKPLNLTSSNYAKTGIHHPDHGGETLLNPPNTLGNSSY